MTSTLLRSTGDLTTFSNGKSFPTRFLKDSLPDVETSLFFAKVYGLSPEDTTLLLTSTQSSPVIQALMNEAQYHSQTLQDFIVNQYMDDEGNWFYLDDASAGEAGSKQPVNAEVLPEVWKNLEVEIAKSIQDVAAKISDTIAHMPGRSGEMVFSTMAKLNAKRPVIGDYLPRIQHQHIKQVLLVFDVSGSMSEATVRTIVDDVVGLAYEANASLAIVSNSVKFWDPGAYDTQVVLDEAEYGGTHYENLAPLFTNRVWDVVITVADYDSSMSSKRRLASCDARIGQLFDISLVSRSTFLAECLEHMADEVRPLLIAQTSVTGW